MSDLEIAIERVNAASAEMSNAILALRRVSDRTDLTISERREILAVNNRARRTVA